MRFGVAAERQPPSVAPGYTFEPIGGVHEERRQPKRRPNLGDEGVETAHDAASRSDQQEALPVTKAGPLDDASDVIEEVDGIQIVDHPQHAVFKISRTRPPLDPRANQG